MRVFLGRTQETGNYYNRTENYYRYMSEREIRDCKPLAKEELKTLFYRYKNNGDMDAFWKIIKSNLRYVMMYAKRFSNSGKISYDNLVAEGNLAIAEALESYDYEKNNGEFRAWANFFLEKRLSEAKEQDQYQFRIPWKYKIQQRKDKKKRESETFQRFSVSDVVKTVNLNDVFDDSRDEKSEFTSYLKDDNTPDDSFNEELANIAMKDLTNEEKSVISYKFGLGNVGEYTAQEIADMMNINKSKVINLQKKAMKKIKTVVEDLIKCGEYDYVKEFI